MKPNKLSQVAFAAVVASGLLTIPAEASFAGTDWTLRLHAEVSGNPEASGGLVKGALRPAEGNARDPLSFDLPLDGEVDVVVPSGSSWRLEIEDARWWSREVSISVDASVQIVEVPLFPAGVLKGRLQFPKGTDSAEDLRLRFQPAPGESLKIGLQYVDCLVDGDEFQCKTPAAVLDLRLRIRGFASGFRWDVPVRPKKPYDLGTLRLSPGASVVGWIELPEDPIFRYAATKISLRPVAALPPQTAGDSARRNLRLRRAVANERGFFKISGVPPGSYDLTLDHPGFATTRRGPVQVLEGAETELRKLVLEKPAILALTVQPPQDPFRNPWQVTLSPPHRPWERAEEQPDPETGLIEMKALEPGPYYLVIKDSHGSSWLSTEKEILPGTSALRVEIALHRLEGNLLYGTEPLKADLWFGGQRASPSIRAQSNDEGKFYVFLPDPYGFGETWDVEVKGSGLHAWIDDVEVPETLPGEPWSRTTLQIPETRLEGEVVTDKGLPVPRAVVRARSTRGRVLETRSSPEGRFELLGLASGLWEVEADGSVDGRERLTSKPVLATVEDDITGEPVSLVLESRRTISGQVIAPSGAGVPGTMVIASSRAVSGRIFDQFSRTLTNVDGVFSFSLPLEVDDPVTVTVFPPGFAVAQAEAVVSPDPASIFIPVEVVAGTLVVTYEGGEAFTAFEKRRRTWLFGPEGTVGTPDSVEEWARVRGHRHSVTTEVLTVPGLSPGPYSVCFGNYPAVLRRGKCVSGEVSPHEELRLGLSLDETPDGDEGNPVNP